MALPKVDITTLNRAHSTAPGTGGGGTSNLQSYKEGTGTFNTSTPSALNDVHIGQDDTIKLLGTTREVNIKNNALVVKSDNNVGIGTSSPSEKLEVNGNVKVNGNLITGTSDSTTLNDSNTLATSQAVNDKLSSVKQGSGTFNTTTPAAANDVHIGQGDVVKTLGDGSFTVKDDRFVVAADGKIGIGTTDPKKSLDVRSGGIALPTGSSNGVFFGSAFTSSVYANGNNSIRIDTGGGNGYVNVTNTGFGILRNPSHRLDVNGNSRLSGSVGINTAPTSEALEVSGNIKLSGVIKTPSELQIGDNAEASGVNSTAVGSLATASDDSTVALGRRAAASSDFSTALGYLAVSSGVNSTALGQLANASASDTMVLGTSATTVFLGDGTAVTSDERDKIDISDNELGLDFVNQIKTRKWRGNNRDQYWIRENEAFKTDEKGERMYDKEEHAKGSKAGKRWHRGIISQEMLELVDPMEFSGVKDTEVNNPDLNHQKMGFSYNQLIAPMIKAIQELSTKVEEKQTQIEKQKTQIEQLLNEVKQLKK